MGNDVFLSTNHGESWKQVYTSVPSNSAVSMLGVSGGKLFAWSARGRVFMSTNNGTTWRMQCDTSSAIGSVPGSVFAVSGTNLFAGTRGGGVFVSDDDGTSWTAVNTGLTSKYVLALAVDGPYLFAGTQSGGVWRRPLSEMITSVEPATSVLPHEFSLEQNYPNPFNPSTTIKFKLPALSQVTLTMYDVLGRVVSVLLNERRDVGVHEVEFDGANLASGVYLYRLTAGSFVNTLKLVLVRKIHPPEGKERAWHSSPGSSIAPASIEASAGF